MVAAALAVAVGAGVWAKTATNHTALGTPPGIAQLHIANSELRRRTAAVAQADKQAASCRAVLAPYVAQLGNLDARLVVGLTFSDYSSQVGTISVTRSDAISREGGLSIACLGNVGGPADKAFAQYVAANNTWNTCVTNFLSCSNAEIKPKLQADWSRAAMYLSQAQHALHFVAL